MSTKDLTLLKEIGLKEIEKLETIGVRTIEQLAEADPDDLIKLKNIRLDKAQSWIRKAQDFLNKDESLLGKTEQKEVEMESKYSLKSTEQRNNEMNYPEDEVREGELRSEK
ncbi:MAG: helix-hairpin-helix domain-containing protein [Promethearchaeia archaeon]